MKKAVKLELETEDGEMFARVDGLRVARRVAGVWVSLVPGWTVRDDGDAIEVVYERGS
jgi:hypothetical protein